MHACLAAAVFVSVSSNKAFNPVHGVRWQCIGTLVFSTLIVLQRSMQALHALSGVCTCSCSVLDVIASADRASQVGLAMGSDLKGTCSAGIPAGSMQVLVEIACCRAAGPPSVTATAGLCFNCRFLLVPFV